MVGPTSGLAQVLDEASIGHDRRHMRAIVLHHAVTKSRRIALNAVIFGLGSHEAGCECMRTMPLPRPTSNTGSTFRVEVLQQRFACALEIWAEGSRDRFWWQSSNLGRAAQTIQRNSEELVALAVIGKFDIGDGIDQLHDLVDRHIVADNAGILSPAEQRSTGISQALATRLQRRRFPIESIDQCTLGTQIIDQPVEPGDQRRPGIEIDNIVGKATCRRRFPLQRFGPWRPWKEPAVQQRRERGQCGEWCWKWW